MSSVENHPSRNLGVSLDKLLVEMFLGGRCLLLRTLLSSLSLWCWVLMSPARCICNLQIRKKTTGWVRVSSLLGDFALLPLQAASKYNSQYHKLFKDIPTEESVLKVCSCALQRDILIQGRLYISPNWLCFYANLFGKDIKVVIPVVSVQLIKKHKTARLLPNGLAITTTASRKYIFVSLISRDSVYDVLRRVCTHLQVSSKKSLSLKEFTEEPDAVSLEVIVPEGKWRKVSPASLSLSLPDADYQCIHRASVSSLSAKEKSAINTEEELEVEQSCVAELRPSDYQLLKIFIVICLLVVSSSYLAFRIFRLEQQLCSLNRDYLSRGHRR
uniref:GRAM domain containing 2A n=1 Tax=Anas platyrhynchos platyrhynchos TaxID=8840 RepID=U3I385_ANAPP